MDGGKKYVTLELKDGASLTKETIANALSDPKHNFRGRYKVTSFESKKAVKK